MRAFVVFPLAAILLLCPLICAAAEPGCCAEQGNAAMGLGCCDENRDAANFEPNDSECPPQQQPDNTSCICAGAVENPANLRLNFGDGGDLFPPAFDMPDLGSHSACLALLLLNASRQDGEPPGHKRGSSLRIHLRLSVYRC